MKIPSLLSYKFACQKPTSFNLTYKSLRTHREPDPNQIKIGGKRREKRMFCLRTSYYSMRVAMTVSTKPCPVRFSLPSNPPFSHTNTQTTEYPNCPLLENTAYTTYFYSLICRTFLKSSESGSWMVRREGRSGFEMYSH